MRTLITGKVVDFVPTFGAHLDGKCLILNEEGISRSLWIPVSTVESLFRWK